MDQTSKIVEWDLLRSKFGIKPGLVEKLVAAAHGSQLNKPSEVREAISAGQFDVLAKLAHGVRGTAANLHALSVQALAGEVETLAIAQNQMAFTKGTELAELVDAMLIEMAGVISGA
ncbi:MAG: hypothetical protein RIR18_529 [Pseudomonadota bacterium]|jgi:HPt (histidine-containing phosphotransfer) domain-containing protein